MNRRRITRFVDLKHWLPLISFLALSALTSSAQIVISEIHYHPVEESAFNSDGTPYLQLTNDIHEFVEIQNTSASTVDLSGWSLGGGISYTFPTNTTIASGGYRVIAKNPSRLATVYSLTESNVLGPYKGVLGNGGDTVRVKNVAGDTIDSVTYDSQFPWAQSADAFGAQDRFTGLTSTNYQYKGRSLQRVSTSWSSSDPANWLASPLTGPTPGAAQSVTRTVPKPVAIAKSAVQASDGATIVRSNQAVTVNCTYSATNSLSSVTLEYFIEDINTTNETRYSVAMSNVSDATYTATIPAQTNRSIVRYRFKADRGDGQEVVSPRSDDPQIYTLGTNGVHEAWWGYFVTPTRTTTNSAIYDIFVSTSSLVTMSNNISQSPNRVTAASATGLPRSIPYVATTSPQWDGTVPGIFACDGEVYDIQIRYHGSRYHRAASNHSYKLHFPDHQSFNDQSSWFETLHGTEFIEAQKINRLLGLPASKMRRVDWYLNSGSNEVHSEQGEYAGEMLDDYHELQQQLNPGSDKEENGELYKDVGNRDATQNNNEGPYTRGDCAPMLTNAGWNQLQRYGWTFSLQNNSWKGSTPIRDIMESMWTARGDSPSTHAYTNTASSVATVKTWYTNNWDIDEIITSMALLEWMSIWDDAAQNCFYWRRANGKWGRLGWDYDSVMATTSGGIGGTTNQTIYGGEYGAATVFDGVNWWKDTFYKTFRTEYQRKLWELNNSFFDPTNLTALGFTRAATFSVGRRAYINSQLSSFGTYYKPNRPTNSYPANGGSVVSATNLITSAYSHSQSTAHYATTWEIRTASGDYEEPLLRVTTTNSSLTSYPIPFDQLTYGQTYYWRATHLDANYHPSVVSAETSFTWGTSNTNAGVLVMNEILAYNRNTVQNGTEYPDYIELRNNSSTNITLTGYTLTDNPLNPTKYSFPSGTTISSGGYLLIWCDNDTTASGLHSGFGLDSDGQTVLLMNSSTIVDSVSFGPQAPDVSIGRIVNGTGGWQANTPTPGTANSAKTLGSVSNLRINEWMANPAYGDDWFEIYNTDTNVVALAGLWLSDTPSTPMITAIPALSFITGNGFQKFSADGSDNGNAHANFKLSNSGESIVLTAANGATTIDTITFSTQTKDVSQGRLPDGASTIVSFSTNTASPGYKNWSPAAVYINEVLANASSPFEDAIEIYNPTTSAVDIGNWWLSDDLLNPKKFQIPSGTTVAAGGYIVFYENQLSAGIVPFALNARGDEVLLSAVDGSGNLTGYASLVRFGASPENTTFGHIAATGLSASSGGAEFWPLTTHTFGQDNPASVSSFRTGTGATNALPKISPIVINEIMYHPPDYAGGTNDTQDEYVELYNTSGATLDLSGWRFKGDSEYTFATNTTLAAGGYLLLVNFNPTNTSTLAAFRATNSVSASTPVYGPLSEDLANDTHDVEIAYPTNVSSATAYVLVDKVEYRDISPWPTTADGSGYSLQRTSLSFIGNTAANWTGATPTPGAVNAGVSTNSISITTASLLAGGVVGTGYTNTLAASGGTGSYSWSITSGSISGITLSSAGVLSGTPTAAGSNYITVQVTDSASASATKSFGITIASTALNITSSSTLTGGTMNTSYSQTLAASGGTSGYTWSLTSGSLPGGLTLNSAGVLSGTPTNYGTFSFTVQVTDAGNLAATKTLSLTIVPQTLTITTTSPMVYGQQNSAYSQALTGAGGVTPYTWSLTSGSLPTGLSLSSVGDITGTPTTLGTFNFTVKLTDSLGTNTTKALAITVVSPTVAIATAVLADSTVGSNYSQTLTATGGTTPYSWNLTWGALPGGLNLSSAGVISGTPTNAGTFSFTIQVADNASATASQLFTVEIQNNAPTVTVQSFSGSALQLQVSGDAGPNYSIESSTNLSNWETRFTTNAPLMPFRWTDIGATNTATFYRAVLAQ